MNKFSIKKIIEQIDITLIKKTPMIHQTESSECGLACLAMVCGHYGKNKDILTLRQQFNMSSRGTDLKNLVIVAEQLGFDTRTVSLEIDEIKHLKTPCILHWNFNHFVLLVGFKANKVIIHDPAYGRRYVSYSEFSNSFTGIAFEMWPGSSFSKQSLKTKFSINLLIKNIYGIKKSLGNIFFLSVVVEFINVLMPIGTQLVMDHAIPANDFGLLVIICIGLAIMILIRSLTSLFRAWISLVMSTLINVQWQYGLFNHLLQLPLSYFERRKLGDIQSRFGSLDTLRLTFTTSVVGAIMDSIMIIGVLIMMYLYGGWLTYIVIAFTALYVLLRLVTFKYYRSLSEELLIRDARSTSYFMETLFGIATIKIQGMAKRRCSNWINLEIDSINTNIKITKMDMLFGGINTFIAACDQIFILYLGVSLVINNYMTIGMFIAFGAFRSQFSERVSSIIEFVLQLRMMSLHNERVADIALSPKESHKSDIKYEANFQPLSLTITDLIYGYDNCSPPVINGLNINIKPGESVAIVGPSGVGKTTLMKIMCGLFKPQSGLIMINGVDIYSLGVNNYHKMIACVMQEDRLFSGTIRENICGFVENIDDNWMFECAKASYLHDIIAQMPMGYETLVGELGEGLSGGQKQRMYIARALYKRPGILFLDEATSALDNESEKAINTAIRNLNITRVIVAHRETTILSADRVINLNL